ncbi:Crp/Fnr family transcriptional regulator [Altererythrobacter sp. CAU 1778]
MASEDDNYPLTGLFLKGRLRHTFSVEDAQYLEALATDDQRYSSTHTVIRRGDYVDVSTMLVEGFMLRCIIEDGKRHIVGIQVPGDFVDLHAFALKRLDHDIVTVGAARAAFVPHEKLEAVMRDKPRLARVLWFSTLLDAAIHREWIMKMEQLNADGRVAHLFAEMWHRLNYVGLADASGYHFPLTQADLADACGTTAIHMNRILRSLREQGVVDFRRGRVTIPDRHALENYGRFNQSFLYGEGQLYLGEGL